MPSLIDDDLFVRLAGSRDYLASAAAGPVTIADAAAQAHISRFHYLRLFQKAFGQTPYQFVQGRRIALAKYLLSSTDLPVTEVCFEVGYESVGSFSSLFRQATGFSPSDFRRRTRPVFAIRWAAQPVFIPSCFMAHYGIDEVPQFFEKRRRAEFCHAGCMIQRLSHHTVYVLDQDQAKDFYVGKLGFELKMDFDMGKFRWLTVAPKGQPDMEFILMPIVPGPHMDEAHCEELRGLVRDGRMPSGVFETADCRKTYDELSAKGVEFKQPPTERFYGIEAILKDPFGNWYSLTQPAAQCATGAKR